jgi:hypothetical protein
MLVYFRYVFGFFMRNFERQADLAVFKALGDSTPLISSLEKISWMSGNIRDKPSWHHFGIGQRVDFLERCSRDKSLIARHDRKVYGSLILFIVLLVFSAGLFWNMDLKLDNLYCSKELGGNRIKPSGSGCSATSSRNWVRRQRRLWPMKSLAPLNQTTLTP